jgi:hypothetical protein
MTDDSQPPTEWSAPTPADVLRVLRHVGRAIQARLENRPAELLPASELPPQQPLVHVLVDEAWAVAGGLRSGKSSALRLMLADAPLHALGHVGPAAGPDD